MRCEAGNRAPPPKKYSQSHASTTTSSRTRRTRMPNDPWDLGGGGQSFAFDRVGDAVEGYILDMVDRQGTDLDTGELAWWDKEHTRPVMLKIMTLQTTLKDNPSDDGK